MKVSIPSFFLLSASLLFSTSVFAAPSKGHLDLSESVSVQGHQLAPGDYKVEWNGTGPNVQLNFLQGKETMVTVPAHVILEHIRNDGDGYAYVTEKDGQRDLTEVFFGGKDYELTIGKTSPKGPSQNSGSRGSKSSS
jgi:hypothetical protein